MFGEKYKDLKFIKRNPSILYSQACSSVRVSVCVCYMRSLSVSSGCFWIRVWRNRGMGKCRLQKDKATVKMPPVH